jgi:hypothetical protein
MPSPGSSRLGSRLCEPYARAYEQSYYANKIEGQQTHPADIERALRRDFDADAALASKQRLAIAHMEVEEELEQTVSALSLRDLFAPQVGLRDSWPFVRQIAEGRSYYRRWQAHRSRSVSTR